MSYYGLVAFGLSLLALLFLMVAVVLSVNGLRGQGPQTTWQGLMAWLGIMLNSIGFVVSIFGEFDFDYNRRLSHLSLGLHSLLLVIHATIIIQGYAH